MEHSACPKTKKGTGGVEGITKTMMLPLIALVHKLFLLSNANNFGSLLTKTYNKFAC